MIEVKNFELENSLFNHVMAEIRDVEIQRDRMRFRRNLERIGEMIAYEISKTLDYTTREVVTPLGVKEVKVLAEQPVLATILRAGLPFHNGMLNMFDQADNAFVAAYRKYDKDDDSEIRVEYFSSADLEGKVLVVCDPLLATGESLAKTIDAPQTYPYCRGSGLGRRTEPFEIQDVALARDHLGGLHRRRTHCQGICCSGSGRCRRLGFWRKTPLSL